MAEKIVPLEAAAMLLRFFSLLVSLFYVGTTNSEIDSSILPSDLLRIHELLEQYADLKLDFTDAAIVALAERLDICKILTVDVRDFGTIRQKHYPYFDLIPA